MRDRRRERVGREIGCTDNRLSCNSSCAVPLASVPRPSLLRVIVCVLNVSLPRTINAHNNYAYWGRPGTTSSTCIVCVYIPKLLRLMYVCLWLAPLFGVVGSISTSIFSSVVVCLSLPPSLPPSALSPSPSVIYVPTTYISSGCVFLALCQLSTETS